MKSEQFLMWLCRVDVQGGRVGWRQRKGRRGSYMPFSVHTPNLWPADAELLCPVHWTHQKLQNCFVHKSIGLSFVVCSHKKAWSQVEVRAAICRLCMFEGCFVSKESSFETLPIGQTLLSMGTLFWWRISFQVEFGVSGQGLDGGKDKTRKKHACWISGIDTETIATHVSANYTKREKVGKLSGWCSGETVNEIHSSLNLLLFMFSAVQYVWIMTCLSFQWLYMFVPLKYLVFRGDCGWLDNEIQETPLFSTLLLYLDNDLILFMLSAVQCILLNDLILFMFSSVQCVLVNDLILLIFSVGQCLRHDSVFVNSGSVHLANDLALFMFSAVLCIWINGWILFDAFG